MISSGTPPGISSHSTAWSRQTTWLRVRERSRWRLAHTFSTTAWPSPATSWRPLDRHAEELPYLIPLPGRAFDPSPVVYRVVDAEGVVAWRGNRYSVPWRYIGQTLPVRVTESELVIYSPQVEEVARHPLFAEGQTGQQSVQAEHRPCRDGAERLEMLRERFARADRDLSCSRG